jgi:hypothetical protein
MRRTDRRFGPLALPALGAVTLALLGGCAVHLVPLHGQTEAQTRIDQQECAEHAGAAGEKAYLQATVWETDADHFRSHAAGPAWTAAMVKSRGSVATLLDRRGDDAVGSE